MIVVFVQNASGTYVNYGYTCMGAARSSGCGRSNSEVSFDSTSCGVSDTRKASIFSGSADLIVVGNCREGVK